MKKILENNIFLVVALGSLILSLITLYYDPVINPDGVLYLRAAAAYGSGGIHSAMSVYSWPFYSVLIALLQKIGLQPYVAAQCFDIFMQMVIAVMFLVIIRELGGNKKTLIYAAISILLLKSFNDIREEIIRDFGYWGFYLIGLWSILRLSKTNKVVYGLFWGMSLLFASLFRVEGVLIWPLLPLAFLLDSDKTWGKRLYCFMISESFLLLLIALGILWQFTHANMNIGRLAEIKANILYPFHVIVANFHSYKSALIAIFPYAEPKKMFILSLIPYFIYEIIITFSLVFSLFFLYSLYHRSLKTSKGFFIILLWLILINLFFTNYFLATNYFLTERYLMALVLVLLLWVPFGMEDFVAYTKTLEKKKQRSYMAVMIGALIYLAIAGIYPFGYSKDYMLTASQWLKQNAAQERVLSNDAQLLYMSKGPVDTWDEDLDLTDNIMTKFTTGKYGYMMLLKKRDSSSPALPQQTPLKVFYNRKKDSIIIYKSENTL